MKLTTEQLLFAHRVGATHSGELTGFYKLEGTGWQFWNEGWLLSNATNDHTASITKGIDFSPLYDWIDHNGGECPVLPDDMVIIELSNSIGGSMTVQASLFDWGARGIDGMLICKRFKLCRAEDWPEQRADAIGQNGNDGEHYDIPPPEYDPRDVAFKPKKSKYHREIAPGVWVDVYDVLKAWKVENPALQHLIKKALQPGERGHKTLDQDMKDIVASAIRAQELASNPED